MDTITPEPRDSGTTSESFALTPTVDRLAVAHGIAGQLAVTAHIRYGHAPVEPTTFVGSRYGGPVIMITPDGQQVFVVDPGRFGAFGREWVRRFYA